jgi:lysozyme
MKSLMLAATIAGIVAALSIQTVPTFSVVKNLKNYPILVKPKHNVEWFVGMTEKVKSFESYKAEPYRCPAGVLTVGYGHTGKYASQSMSLSKAETVLMQELTETKKLVLRHVKVKLTEYQLAALVSFTHNTNEGCLKSLITGPNRLNSGNYDSVVKLLPLYCKANGKTLRGLVIRRGYEVKLWQGLGKMSA